MSIATMFRGFRKLKALHCVGAISHCVCHSGDSTMGASSFVQKHVPYYGQLVQPTLFKHHPLQWSDSLPQYSSVLRGNKNFIQDQVLLACAHPLQKQDLSRQDVGRMLRFLQLHIIKRKLRSIPDAYISYSELVKLCRDCTEEDQSRDIIHILEQSGHILRIGKMVYLHSDKVARAMERVLPILVEDESCTQELQKMMEEKAEIDIETEKLVRYEMWGGLGFLSVQTAVLLRLTFWELSWDIMEPICFYLTSIYFMLGYAFFIRTSVDPTFETFFVARFKIKQRKLMKRRNFSLERYTELQRITIDKSN